MSATNSTTHPLTMEDLRSVLEELANEAASKWYQIGVQLTIKPDQLNSFKQQNPSDNNAVLCQVLVTWIKLGKATWESLCDALASKSIGENALAEKLRNDYCTTEAPPMEEAEPEGKQETETEKQQKPTGSTKRLVRKVPQRFSKDDFCQAQKSDRICFKCKQVPLVPQRLQCCQRIYCDMCSPKIKECKKCKKSAEFKKDQELYSKIQKVKIKCPNRTRGCTWKGIVSKLKDHLGRPDCTAIKEGKKSTGKGTTKPGEGTKPASGENSRTTPTRTPGQGKKDKSSTASKSTVKKPTRKPEDTKLAPPLNLVMENVGHYKDSGEVWISDTFRSHQLGYKLCLAVKLAKGSGEESIDVTLAVTSPGVESSAYLDYPRIGNATIAVLYPIADASHEIVEPFFMLENIKKPTSVTMPDVCDQTEISGSFVLKDCLFFRVDRVEIQGGNFKPWLLDAKPCENVNRQ